MIDTIKLRIRRPLLRPDTGLTVVPLAKRYGRETIDRLFKFDDAVTGEETLVREVNMHQDGIDVRSYAGFLLITFQLPQLQAGSPSGVEPVSLEQAARIFFQVECWCREKLGMKFHIEEAELSRLDLFANARCRYTFGEFAPLFELLKFGRRVNMQYKNSVYGFSTYSGTCIYDRGDLSMRLYHEARPLDDNLIRWEFRLKNHKSIIRALNLGTLNDLLTRWGELKPFYLAQVRTALRIGEELERDSPVSNVKEEIMSLQEFPGDVKSLTRWWDAHASRLIQERCPSIPILQSMLRELGFTAVQIRRFLYAHRRALTTRLAGDAVSINDLRNELYTKLQA